MKKLVRIKRPEADLAGEYRIHLLSAIAVILVLLIMVFRVHFNPSYEMNLTEREQATIQLEDIIQTSQVLTPPPPQRPRVPVSVPNEEMVEDSFYDFDFDVDPDQYGLPKPPPTLVDEAEEPEPEFFIFVEQMPYILGGMDALYAVLEYPELARRAGVQGRVVVRFIIDEHGNVRNPVVVRGVGAGLDEAAIRAIESIRFEPGRQRGRAVAVQYTIPVNFTLQR